MSNHAADNSIPLSTEGKSDDVEGGAVGQRHRVKDYRKLAIISIICGLSCMGITALIYSVKTREIKKRFREETTEKAVYYSRKTFNWAVGAIMVWVILLILIPTLLVLISYLLTLID